MKYSFKEHEKNFVEWCRQEYVVALTVVIRVGVT